MFDCWTIQYVFFRQDSFEHVLDFTFLIDHASFSMGVCRHLCAMLEKTENDVFGDRANEWVTCDATKREYLDGAGTFRYIYIYTKFEYIYH